MAHESQVRGGVSELTAARALMENGWEVSSPIIDESYDLVAKDPDTGDFKTFQVKTIQRRPKRGNAPIIYATKSNGVKYEPADCDYIVGIEGDDVYLTENVGHREYWAKDGAEHLYWTKLTN